MEIDLELPSVQEEKLEAEFDTNSIEGTNGVHAGEEDINTPRTSGHVEENPRAYVDKNIIRGGDGVVLGTLSVDSVRKHIPDYEPHKGLEFDSKEDAYSFYREYARSVGFGITIKASRRSKKSGRFIDVKIVCSRFGSKRESATAVNSRSCPKTDCKASMHMKRRQDGKWFIYGFVKEHNHEICPDDFYHALRGSNRRTGIVGCHKKGLQLALDEGDVETLLETFMLMQAENPSFLYAIDLDQEKRMRNVFWVDPKGRHDYSFFCDVVFFDTNYFRNQYRMPFLPVVGVNHHFQYMLLGCALIGDDMASTFVWLMRTWLKAMGGRTPRVVITDEDKSLKEAVAEVFPDAHHCFCLWHVLRKIPGKLCHITQGLEIFTLKFNKCIHRSWTNEVFEKRWWKMVDKFELRTNEWIQSLYEDREKWVPIYMRDTFLAGFCTTDRSEGISSIFDKYINRETTFKELVDQYKGFLFDRYLEEAKSKNMSQQELPALRSLLPFEKQMSTVYTHEIFKKFQAEVLGTFACSLQRECENEGTVTLLVDDFEQRQNFCVTWNEAESDLYCLCHSFEYKGFLCRHAMIVLKMSGVYDIPAHYILKRWTKDAKTSQSIGISNKLHYRVQRFNDLCKLAVKLGEEGSLSQETYDIAFYALEEALKNCVGVNDSVRISLEPNMLANQSVPNSEGENQGSNMAKGSKKKKIQKKRKVQSEAEVISSMMRNSSQHMLPSRAHPLDISYVPQQDMQEMDIGSSTPTLDGYYRPQQSVHGVGQLNSLSSMNYSNQQNMPMLGQLNSVPACVGHYGPRQSLQGLLQGHLGFRAPIMHGGFSIEDSLHNMEQSVNLTSRNVHDEHMSP